MKDTCYAFAVANIRAAEPKLLESGFVDQLIESRSEDVMKQLLADKGILAKDNGDITAALSGYMSDTWDFICDIAPDKEALEFLIVGNDFHNLKAALKALVNNKEPGGYYLCPSVLNPDETFTAVRNKQFDTLPEWLSGAAEKGYELLTATMDGQLLDVFIDCEALKASVEFSKKSGSEIAEKFAETTVALADYRIAFRAAKCGKGETLLNEALCETGLIDVDRLRRAALKSEDDVLSAIAADGFDELSECREMAEFEKECDNYLLHILDETAFVSFGIEPLIAYYYARATECKTLRIIISCKHNGIEPQIIKERVRELYE